MKSSTLRSLKFLRFPARSSSPSVAPWPIPRNSFDEWLARELNNLKVQIKGQNSSNETWSINALKVAISSQEFVIRSFSNIYREEDTKFIQEHADDIVELLDACNKFRENIDFLHNYVASTRIVLHWLDGNSPNKVALERARVLLDSCYGLEKKYFELQKSSSNVRKLVRKCSFGTKPGSQNENELCEMLNGSRAITLLAVEEIEISLSLKFKRSFPMTRSCQGSLWSSSINELLKEMKEEIEKDPKLGGMVQDVVKKAFIIGKGLRNLINSQRLGNKDWEEKLRANIQEMRDCCEELKERITKPLEGRLNELYKNLISVRLDLLNNMSQLQT